ncbi:MAG: glycerophosphodiester phosphodiesterase, partial [Clostridia bacterium]|nr:glycerophosphodiester phosphodiesterase [Clostridia bacterium]
QIEIKEENYDKLYTVIDAIKSKGLEKTAIIISFDLEQLKVIHELDSSIELWYLIGKITEENIREAKAIGDNVWLSPGYHDNNEESIKLAVDAKIGLSFWTVNKIEDARKLYNMGVRYIESDILCK